MRTPKLLLPFVVALCSAVSIPAADELLPADRPVEDVIDHYIDARLKDEGVKLAPAADDANFIRRLTLDLAGRIPTVAETAAYVTASDAAKRAKLVDRLMSSPGFVRHQVNEFDVLLMSGAKGSARDYLNRAIGENRPWDRIFRELMVPDESDPSQKGSSEFVKQRVADVDKLTTEVSTLFFGVNVSCARCHDHPLIKDWTQFHYYGMKAFFARTFDNGGFLAEREYGQVKFKTTKGLERDAKMMFLTGAVADIPITPEPSSEEQKKEKERFETFKKEKKAPPPPKVSARAQFVELALKPEQRDFFARAIVNRLWHRLFGYGLVMPLDQMHAENPPSHPELLTWLARDLVERGYDLRRLMRGLVLSRAYARNSRWEGGSPPPPSLFAFARVRPLTPMQLAVSLRLATTDPAGLAADLKSEELEKRLEGLEASARGLAGLIAQPGDDFQIGVGEALLFSNSDRIMKELLSDGGDRLIGRLQQTKEPKESIDLAVRSVLSRPPTARETQVLGDYLRQRTDRPAEAFRQLVWALLTSTEFRFNY
jgi:hypothetical protein